jgi:hypothetical protein
VSNISGNVSLLTNNGITSGDVDIRTGTGSTGDTGDISLICGVSSSANGGVVNIQGGNSTATGSGGDVNIDSGTSGTSSGSIDITLANQTNASISPAIKFTNGATSSPSFQLVRLPDATSPSSISDLSDNLLWMEERLSGVNYLDDTSVGLLSTDHVYRGVDAWGRFCMYSDPVNSTFHFENINYQVGFNDGP